MDAIPPERFAALAELLRVCNREDYLKLRATLYNNLPIILAALDMAAATPNANGKSPRLKTLGYLKVEGDWADGLLSYLKDERS